MEIKEFYLKPVLLAAVVSFTFSARAQLHESVNVEGKYIPEIIPAERINIFPNAIESSIAIPSLEYERNGVPTSFNTELFTMPATGWKDTRKIYRKPGYVEAGIGSWLNSNVSAGYRFINTDDQLLGVRLQHNSTSLWKPKMSRPTLDTRQYRYDEAIGVFYGRSFTDKGRLSTSLDYNLGVFNYYGAFNPLVERDVEVPKQAMNDVAFKIGWNSPVSAYDKFRYGVAAGVRYLGYNKLPTPLFEGTGYEKGMKETDIFLEGGIYMPWSNGSRIKLDAKLDALLYSGNPQLNTFSNTYLTLSPDNYAMLSLKPSYMFSKGIFDIKLGVDIDLSFNAGEKGSRYSLFHIAPDISVNVNRSGFAFYVKATGGSELNTLSHLRQLDYYQLPAITTTRPTYTPLDALVGINLGPFSGFSAKVDFRYKISRHVPMGGWYTAWLDYGQSACPNLEVPVGSNYEGVGYSLMGEGINLHGVSISGKLAYNYADKVMVSAEGSWQPQDGETGIFNGYDRPKVTAKFQLDVKPISPLTLSAWFDYRGGRRIYTRSYYAYLDVDSFIPETAYTTSLASMHLPDMSTLNARAEWDFNDSFSVWVEANNLLNRRETILPFQPSQGIVALAGIKWIF